ncbi:hypothetical protein HN873_060070 [Arachis hypogaea]
MFFVASPEPCPAALTRLPRALPRACTRLGVRGTTVQLFGYRPKRLTLRAVPRVSFLPSFETCPAALARPSRMLPLACTRLGVRGATVQLFGYRPKRLTLRAVPRVSFVPSLETCPAALARPSRMLPLACTRLGVRGAVHLGVLGLRTMLADEWCVGLECCLAPCLAQRTGAPDPLHVWARATVLVPLLCGSCVSYPVVWYPCLAPTFPLRSPLVGLPGEFQDTPVVLPVSALCAATVACVRVLFSLVQCTRLGWGLRSPSVPQMIRFLGKTPAAVSFESFPSRGASAAR